MMKPQKNPFPPFIPGLGAAQLPTPDGTTLSEGDLAKPAGV